MPEDMVEELEKFEESHTQDEIFDYLENLYSYIQVIDTKYNTLDIDLEKAYTKYTAIIKQEFSGIHGMDYLMLPKLV